MRTSDHPAAKPRQYRAPVYRADDEPETDQSGLPTDPAEREALRQRLIEQGALPAVSPERVAEIAAIPDEDIDTSDIPDATADELETAIASAQLQATREPIASAPQDGSYVHAFWGEDDVTGRLVRWRQGRHFNNRRWVTGGAWAPADGMIPLPVQPPTEWLKPPEMPEPEGEAVEEEEAA